MNPGSVLAGVVFRLERFDHQRQIKAFEEKFNAKDGSGKNFAASLFRVAQSSLAAMAGAAMAKPVSTFVYALLASSMARVNAAPLTETGLRPFSGQTMKLAAALDNCLLQHRHDDVAQVNKAVRCLGEVAGDLCSGREPGSGSRYNFGIRHDESNSRHHNECLQRLGRSAGVHSTIKSAHKTAGMIVEDVVRDVTANGQETQARMADARDINEVYDLRGEVDDSIMDARDVSDWVSRHRSELEAKSLVWPPDQSEFMHAADNRYKETNDIRDQATYRDVLDRINRMDMRPYENRYFGELAVHMAGDLKV